jgi:glycosyltransferase involved in cell wall biosynthesis
MKVGIDATGWTNRRGYGRFARNAIGRLVELDGEAAYVLYTDEVTASHACLPRAAEVRVVALRRVPVEAASAHSNRPLGDVLRLTAAVRKDRPDVFLFPSLQTYFPVVGTPTVVGLHDAIPDELPQLTMPSRRARTFWHAKQTLAIRLAARIFTVSEASRETLAHRFGLARRGLAVVPEAPDPVFVKRSHNEVARARAAVGLKADDKYFLFAGGISPHKDVETLVEAFARVRVGRLVLVGDLESEAYVSAATSVRERIAAHHLGENVLLPGYVDDESLAALYSDAAAVVIPSLAEGFGLPAVEAAACGAPLVLSDLPAHRETLGSAALFFPPGDADALAERLREVLAEPSDLGARARAAVRNRTWDDAAEVLRGLLADAAHSNENGRRR